MILKFRVEGQTLFPLPTNDIPREGSRDYLKVDFDFGCGTEAYTKTVYFTAEEEGEEAPFSTAVVYEGEPIRVDDYFAQKSFAISVGFVLGERSYTTNEVSVPLDPASDVWLNIPPNLDIPAYQQLVNLAENAATSAESAAQDAADASASAESAAKDAADAVASAESAAQDAADASASAESAAKDAADAAASADSAAQDAADAAASADSAAQDAADAADAANAALQAMKGCGYINVTEDYRSNDYYRDHPEEYLRSLGKGKWLIDDGWALYRMEIFALDGQEWRIEQFWTDDGIYTLRMFNNSREIVNFDSGNEELIVNGSVIAPSGDKPSSGVTLPNLYFAAQAEAPSDFPNGAFWLDTDEEPEISDAPKFVTDPDEAQDGDYWLDPSEDYVLRSEMESYVDSAIQTALAAIPIAEEGAY